jgi:hypothetical protein
MEFILQKVIALVVIDNSNIIIEVKIKQKSPESLICKHIKDL